MKLKSFLLVALVALMVTTVTAQTLPTDLTLLGGGPFHHADGAEYNVYYSPSSITRTGDWTVITFEILFPAGQFPTKFYVINQNCSTDQYTFAAYDTTTTPPTLGAASEVKSILPNTVGSYLKPIVCK